MGIQVKLTPELIHSYVDKLEAIARKYNMNRERVREMLNREEIRELLPDAITQDFLEMMEQYSGYDSRRRKFAVSE